MKRLLLFVFFAFSIISDSYCQYPIRNGVLDLRYERTIAEIDLVGEWEFYWHKHYLPTDFRDIDNLKPDIYVDIPSYWTEYIDEIPEIEAQGYATYRLRIYKPHSLNKSLFLKVPIFDSSYRLYVNGEFVNSSGVAGTTPQTSLPEYQNFNYVFKPQSDTIDIIVNVTNFHHRRGGFWLPMIIGEQEHMEAKQKKADSLSAMSTGMLLAFVLFFTIFFLMFNDDRTMLYFALATLCIAVRSVVTGSISLKMFFIISWTWLIRIEYISTYIALIFAIWYFHYVYKDKFMPWINTVLTVVLGLGIIVVMVSPVTFFSYTMNIFLILATIVLTYYFIRSIIAAVKEEKYKISIAVGFGGLLLGLINDSLHSSSLSFISGEYIMPYAMLFFVIMQVITLLNKWLIITREEKRLLAEIEYVNRNLENIVIERTSELSNQKKELGDQKKETDTKNKELEKTIAVKNRIFSIIAHDLKSPVLNLSLMIDQLKNIPDHESRNNIIESISQQSGFAISLIENLLLWGEGQRNSISYKPDKYNLTDVVLENFNLLRENADRKQIKMSYSHKGEPIAICDKDLINIVLRNTLSNSIKFTQTSGTISVSVEESTVSKGTIYIRVKDNGVGIPKDTLDKIMSDEIVDSSRGTNDEKGTGLGLQLCKDLVRINKGSISISSEVNHGTTITIMLPAPTKSL